MEITKLCFVVSLILSLILAVKGCPNGWIQHDSSCYHFSHESETWMIAMNICELFEGELATIQSFREEQFIVNQIKASKVGPYFWLGGNDLMVEGEWVWAKSGERITSTYWNPGQPDNAKGENCLVISKADSYRWNDAKCHINAYYVCEQPIVKQILG